MAYKKQYYVRTKFYSCFSRHGVEVTTENFDTIREAWECYKKHHAHDFDYGDASHETDPVQFRWVNDVEDNGNEGHPHCRSWYKERKGKTPIRVCKVARERFDDDELNYLLNLGEDEPKDFLIFDDDDLDEVII